MSRFATRKSHQIRQKIAERAQDRYQGAITIAMVCKCGHRGTVRVPKERAATATFTCKECGHKHKRPWSDYGS